MQDFQLNRKTGRIPTAMGKWVCVDNTKKTLSSPVCGWNTSRQLRVRYKGATSNPLTLFLVKFTGALLKPPIPRPFTRNKATKEKYRDDQAVAVSNNWRKSLISDPCTRPKPLNYQEHFLGNQVCIYHSWKFCPVLEQVTGTELYKLYKNVWLLEM